MTDAPSFRIIWSPRAIRDLAGIRTYIGQFAPLAAQRFTARLVAVVESLAHHPDRGRPLADAVRELTIVRPYLVLYEVQGGLVHVLHIRHGARQPD
jgi:addiction module RelE/StbE family toxin